MEEDIGNTIALDVDGRAGPSALCEHMWERPRLLTGDWGRC